MKGVRIAELAVSGIIVAADQATKAIIRSTLPVHDSVTVIPGLLDITHVRNAGAAFGILSSADFPFKSVVMALIAVTALVAVPSTQSIAPRNEPLF